VARPGRQAGIGREREMSAEGAALGSYKYGDLQIHLVPCLRHSSFLHLNPGLTAGPSHCRSFGPKKKLQIGGISSSATATAGRPCNT